MSEPTTQPPKNPEYLNKRLQELAISPAQNSFERVWINPTSVKGDDGQVTVQQNENKRTYQIFDCDAEGNIVIRYFNQHGQPYRWKKEDTKQTRDYVRLRLREPKGDMKYASPGGSPSFPFFPPGLIKKYMAGEHINTLFVIEGEFKAFKGEMCGIDIIGLPGIFGFYNGDLKGKLHDDIQDIIIKCRVTKVVLLFDADILGVKWEETKDLAKRPMNFYGAIKAFRESLQPLLDASKEPVSDEENTNPPVALELVYFMHIKLKYLNDAKGLDDLLCKYESQTLEIIADLCELQLCRKYFEGTMITDLNKDVHTKVYRYLGLSDEQEFYKTYREFIGAREFKFKRKRYEWDQENKEVKYVRHEDADKFMRIGSDWVKVITKRNKFNEPEEEIVSWKISEIMRDYKKYPDFIEQLQKYDDFTNEPNWNGSYKRVIDGCFNLCNPLKWQPKEGGISATIGFLKHIFQGQGQVFMDQDGKFEREEPVIGDPFTVAMDYITILIKHPKHMLPVPILVSQENGTGKSTFLKWMQILFGSNMCILGNEQFKMKFNGHYITKFIIAIDEGFLEVDKKAEKERLKQLVTADSAYLENKGMNVRKINYYGKLMICSNDADRVMKIDDGESRWFVVKVPVLTQQDPDLELKLKNEMEAFLHFIYNRPIAHERVGRLWFKPEWFITDQFKVIVETTKNRVDRVFEDWLREQFMLYRLPVLRYSMKYLTEVFNDPKTSKYKVDAIDLKNYLNDKLKMKASDIPQRINIPVGYDVPDDTRQAPKIIYRNELQRPYRFEAINWLTPEQIDEWKKPLWPGDTNVTNGDPTMGNGPDEPPF